MRRLKSFFILMLSIVCILCSTFTVFGVSASLTGPDTVRAGDTITLKLNVNDSGKYGLEGALSFDSNVVSLVSSTSKLSGWKLESNGNSFIMYDDTMSNPLNENNTVATFIFKVNSNIAAGTNINISVNNLLATDGSSESNLGSATYSKTVAKAKSNNANLSSLVVNGKNLDVNSISHNIGEVDFNTSKLDITYKTEDGNAKASVSGNSLKVGNNTVTVTVKAENGATKNYKIIVTRKQDPNYIKSSDASLSSITLNKGELSPTFSKEITNYVVYLPYETIGSTYSINGTAANSNALEVKKADIILVEGINEAKIVCVAEDGTSKEYTITVVVMPKYEGILPEISGVKETETPSETITETTTLEETTINVTTEVSTIVKSNDNSNAEKPRNTFAIIVIIVIAATFIGLSGYAIFTACKIGKLSKEDVNDIEDTENTENKENTED